MSHKNQSTKVIEDEELIDGLIDFMDKFSTNEIYYYQKWNFNENPFDQRAFGGDRSSVKSRRINVLMNIIKELVVLFKGHNHILFKSPSGSGKTFLLQEIFALVNNSKFNESLSKNLQKKESVTIAIIDGFILRDLEQNERMNYLVEQNVCSLNGQKFADIVIIDNFAPLHKIWHQFYPKFFGQSFLIASIQTSEFAYLEALKNKEIDIPFRENMVDETQIKLTTSDPLDIFTKNIELQEWTLEELEELLKLRIENSNSENGFKYFSKEFFSLVAKNSLSLPGLCLDIASEILKRAITDNLHDLTDKNILEMYIGQNFVKASELFNAFKLKDKPKLLKEFNESTISIINQLNKKTRKDLMKRLLIAMGGYHIQTNLRYTVGTNLDDYFNTNDLSKANDLANSLSPTKLAIVLDKTQSTLSYHLNWFQNEEMLGLHTATTVQVLKKSQTSFDKFIMPSSPFFQLFEIILQMNPN